MRKELRAFTDSLSGNFPITVFPGGSLCAFHDGFLYILKHFSLIEGKIEYSQHVKIVPVPAISSVIKVNSLKVSQDGSRVILLGDDVVCVILIELEVLKILSKKSSCVEVFCESQNIASKFAKYGKSKVVDAIFIPDNLLPGSHLSVLTSDNFIRVYSLISDVGTSVIDIDLNSLLQNGSSNDVSYLNDNTFGLYSNIVCYELITCVSQLTFLLCDSDGQLHTAIVTDDLSPFLSSLKVPLNFPCEFSVLHSIKHPLEQVFSAYAAVLCEGSENLTHFIIIPNAGAFEIYFHERVELNAYFSQAFFSDFGENCYCLGTPRHLYLIDCRKWINYYGEITLNTSTTSTNTDSQLHVVALCNQTEVIENLSKTAGQLVSLKCSTENGVLTMLLVQFSSSALFPSFIKNKITTQTRIKDASQPTNDTEDWKATKIDPLIEQMRILPKLTGFAKGDSKKTLRELEQWLSSLFQNLNRLKSASSNAVKRLSEISPIAKALIETKNELISRLAVVSADMIRFHEEASHRRHMLDVLANRIDSLTRRASEKRPLTAQEKQMLKTLKDYKKQAVCLSDRAAHMHIEVAEAKRNTFGPAKSFQPSTASYLSSIEKSSREIDAIVSRITKITQTIDCM